MNALPNVNRLDQRMSAELADDLRNWLVEPEFSKEQRILLDRELDAKQRGIAETRPGKTGLRKIRGPAGSGKSVVLAGRAAKLAEEGKSVLLVTFNITLINCLLDYAVRLRQSGKVRAQITALNFHHWCKRVALQTGHIGDYDTLWQSENHAHILDTLLAKATEQWLADIEPQDKYQAILVDEGQDFRGEWWSALKMALAEDGEMLLCADKTQNIYGMPQAWTDAMLGSGLLGRWTELNNSYRLPPSLCDLATKFIEEYLPAPDNPRPVPVQGQIDYHTELTWMQVRPEETIVVCCDALLDMIKKARPQIAFADLTLIVDNAEVGRGVVARLMKSNIHCIDTFEDNDEDELELHRESRRKKLAFFKGDARVKVTTLHSFKGWESSALIVQFAHASSPKSLALFYAGMTRLKRNDQGSYLTIVCGAPYLESFGRKWPDFRLHRPELIPSHGELPDR